MRNRTGILLLASFVSLGTLAIKAAPQRAQQEGQQDSKNMNHGIPWAYGFATPYVAAPAPGAGGAAEEGVAPPRLRLLLPHQLLPLSPKIAIRPGTSPAQRPLSR